jgi:GNAT superfamily N-acetyltransferase
MERWDRSFGAELAALVDSALPGEGLGEDDLVACLWEDDDPSVVFGLPGVGVAAAVVRRVGAGAEGRRVGFVQLVAVAPSARRQGHGRALLTAVEEWAFGEQLALSLGVGGGAPFYLWPGVDVHATAALCFFEALGYRPGGSELNMSFPTRHRAPVPEGVVLRRALDEADVAAGLDFVSRSWPNWVAETRRAIEHGTCHLAFADPPAPPSPSPSAPADAATVVGFGCHSVNRLGWLGPMGTDPDRRHAGLGNALLGAIATDLMAAGLESVEVAWVGPLGFYANAAGATVSRAFRSYGLSRRAKGSA